MTPGFAQNLPDASRTVDDLFHPTSKKRMREFSMDRPDVTESAYTVDAGHFQFEADVFKMERTTVGELKTIKNSFNVVNLKLGITPSLDLQVVAATLFTSKIKDGILTDRQSGFGGLTFRAKQNIWGNNSGKTALAILPFVNVPTVSSEKFSGGITIPFALSLPGDWGFGAQVETDLTSNAADKGHHINLLFSATASHPLSKKFDFFAEGVVTREGEIKEYEYFADGGLIYTVADNINIDIGIYYGLKNTSAKSYFLGFSFRL